MSSMSSVIIFIIFILLLSLCCNLCRCWVECMCRWADWWYELKQEEEYRQTQIVPSDIFIRPESEKEKYIVVMNPQGHPISLGLSKEYSNV